jgi:putative ABC transport system substrate-binding protein
VNPKNVMTPPTVRETEKAAAILRLKVDVVEIRSPDQLESAIAGIAGEGTAAVVAADPNVLNQARRIQALLLKHRIPATHAETGWLQAGALMLFGSSELEHYRHAATLVDKILRGARVAELPVEQSTRFELVINLKTAKALGLTIPPSLLARADRVIE